MNTYFKGALVFVATLFSYAAWAQGMPTKKEAGIGKTYKTVAATSVAKAASSDSEWKSLGTGKFRDDFVTSLYFVDSYEFEVEVQENTALPGLYRVVSPYKNYPISPANFDGDTYLEIDASNPEKVFFDKYDTGLDWGGGNIYINSIAGDYYFNYGGGAGLDMAYQEGLCGTLDKDGIITFPKGSLLINEDGSDLYRQCNLSGNFRLMLPGAPDLDIAITVEDIIEKDGKEYIPVYFALDDDIEKVKVAMVEGEYSSEVVENIEGGAIQSDEITQSGEMLFPYEKDGVFTFVAVPYFGGEAKKVEYLTKELSYKHYGWEDVGTAMYTEGFIADCEVTVDNMNVVTTSVAVQENTEKPGLFRLVDPYGPGYQYYDESVYDLSHHYYMEIDASDPDRVVLNEMSEGCGLSLSFGRTVLWSRAGYYLDEEVGMSVEEVEAKGVYGKRVGNTITFPRNALLIKFIDVFGVQDVWYWANCKGSFKVVLPESTGISSPVSSDADANSKSNAPAEYYTLDGIKVTKANLRKGVYVKKQGANTSKVLIK